MKRILFLSLVAGLLVGAGGCGSSVDGNLTIKLIWGCRPAYSEVVPLLDQYCIEILQADGTSAASACAPDLDQVALISDDSGDSLVRVVVTGLQNGQPLVRGVSVPVRLVSGEDRVLSVPVALLGEFLLLAGTDSGCQPLPFAVGFTPALATISGHVLVAGSPDPNGDPSRLALIVDPSNNRITTLETPPSMRRGMHAVVPLEDGRVVVAGGVDAQASVALDTVVVLRGGEIFTKSYDRSVNYGLARFEQLASGLVQQRPNPVAARLHGRDILFSDGQSTAELWQGDDESSAFITLAPGSADPFPLSADHSAASVVPLDNSSAVVLGGPVNHQGLLRVEEDSRQLFFTEYGQADGSRDHPLGVNLGSGLVMFLGGYTTTSIGQHFAVVLDTQAGRLYPLNLDDSFLPRQGFTANLLPDGRVLVAGGTSGHAAFVPGRTFFLVRNGAAPDSWELLPGPDMLLPRAAHASALLPDGRLLLLGGISADGNVSDEQVVYSAEVIAFR
ncbi:MAG: hypothetical protein DRI34_09160 [Deltaproteobacteria bacterium]|nr:MAG: hypothetical protein DRI34_09160 [Deltaproteobacteria bacterium]